MRNTIIDNLRGICMLGVIGIHIGSLALAPNNFTLYLLLEILSRYSVPSFFFISGYGLACTDKGLLSGSRLNYIDFMKKRLRGAGLPYVSWSLFYMLYFHKCHETPSPALLILFYHTVFFAVRHPFVSEIFLKRNS